MKSTIMKHDMLSLLKMIQASDSMFPIGQFTLSNGLETFVQENRLQNDGDLEEYIASYISVACYNDLLSFLLSCQEDLEMLDHLSFCLKTPMEVRVGSQRLARRFIRIWKDMDEASYPGLMKYGRWISQGRCYGVFSIAAGLYAGDTGLLQEEAAAVFLYSQLSAIVTNAVKTVPLSQTRGQAVLNNALPGILEAVNKAKGLKMEDLGAGGSMFDIEAMRHECLYSRLYMS